MTTPIDAHELEDYIRRLQRSGPEIARALDLETERQASQTMAYAKIHRFRRIVGANQRDPITGMYVIPALPDILTMRQETYLRSIAMNRLGDSDYEVVASVNYAEKHERQRPVLTKALKDREQEILTAIKDALLRAFPVPR